MFSPRPVLEIGDPVPSIAASDQDGAPLDLAACCSRGYALFFFFPRAETPGCVAQACSLRDAFVELQEWGVSVVGVSQDSVERQKRFQQNRNLPYPLIADEDKGVIKAFGVPFFLGLTKRQAFLFEDGKLVWKDESAATDRQAEDALSIIRGRKRSA